MSQAFGGTGNRRKPTINITSLIDVMFLLLIFFMVSSTFKEEEQAIDITLPQAGSGTAQELQFHEIIVTQDGEYRTSEGVVDATTLRVTIEQLIAEDPGAKVVLRADAGADWQPIVSAIDILRQSGVSSLSIPTDRLEEAPADP